MRCWRRSDIGLMCLVSGLFVDAGLRKGLGPFFNNKVRSILYSFVVWVAVYGGLKILFSSMANTPQSPMNIILFHLTGGGDMTGFLHSLFSFFIAIIFARHLPFLLVFASFDNTHINKLLYLFIFFSPGDDVVRKQVDITEKVQHGPTLLISLVSFIVLSCLNIFVLDRHAQALLSPLALLSVPLFVWISLKLKSELVYCIGVNSIVFYLSHYLAIQFCRKIVKFESPSAWANDVKFISAFLVALALPWTLYLMRKRGWFNFFCTMKKSMTSKTA